MLLISKENGHRVSPMGKMIFSPKKYPQEAYDVHTQYSTLFSVSSNPHYESICFIQSHKSFDQSCSRQTIPFALPSLWQFLPTDPQLGGASGPRPEFRNGTGMAAVSVSQDSLSFLQSNHGRRAGTVRSVSAGDKETGSLYPRTLQEVDRQGGGRSSGIELEDRQEDRQTLPGGKIWRNRLPGASHFGGGRNSHPQGTSLPDCGIGLPQRTGGLDREVSKSLDAYQILQPYAKEESQSPGGHCDGYVGPLYHGSDEESPSC